MAIYIRFLSWSNRVHLTAFTDFGLRMLMRMAAEPDKPFSTGDLAAEFGLSRNHLVKIMQRLAHGGIVETRRGGGGGALLARQPAQISVGDIVRLLDSDQPLVECLGPDPSHCRVDGRCRLKGRLLRAQAAFMAELDGATLADIALPPDALMAAPT